MNLCTRTIDLWIEAFIIECCWAKLDRPTTPGASINRILPISGESRIDVSFRFLSPVLTFYSPTPAHYLPLSLRGQIWLFLNFDLEFDFHFALWDETFFGFTAQFSSMWTLKFITILTVAFSLPSFINLKSQKPKEFSLTGFMSSVEAWFSFPLVITDNLVLLCLKCSSLLFHAVISCYPFSALDQRTPNERCTEPTPVPPRLEVKVISIIPVLLFSFLHPIPIGNRFKVTEVSGVQLQ